MSKPLVSGAEFHKFEEKPEFIGKYVGPQAREKDAPDAGDDASKKAGAIIGYNFDDVDGNPHLISNSALVKKAIEQIKPGDWLKIVFTGKSKNAKGQPVNRFKIDLLDESEIPEPSESGEEK